jgi:hypothetical protein
MRMFGRRGGWTVDIVSSRRRRVVVAVGTGNPDRLTTPSLETRLLSTTGGFMDTRPISKRASGPRSMSRGFVMSVLVVVCGAILMAGCGSSPRTQVAPRATVRAVTTLIRASLARRLPGLTVVVRSVRLAASDPHFARAIIHANSHKQGGFTAVAVAIEIGGVWSMALEPSGRFHNICITPTAPPVHQLLCPNAFSG